MDKYEYQLKLDQINKLIERNDYATALKIANNIDWRRVRSVNTLCKIADVYEKNEEYEESRDLLVMAYERAPVGRMIAYRLSDISIKLQDYDQAIEYYKDFVHSAPQDPSKLLLKYKIFRGKGAALKDQIAILEEYRNQEYEEEWALELAYLYQEAGDIPRCVNECDELILWFNDGQYVMKAMELKMQYAELTPAQQEKYELRMNRTKLVDAREDTKKRKAARRKQEAQPEEVPGYQQNYDPNYEQQTYIQPEYQQEYEQAYDPMYQEPYYGGYEAASADDLPQIQDPELVMPQETLTIEDDGQMKIEMPDYQPVEKQITGQMTIQEILAEWERVKQPQPEEAPEEEASVPEAIDEPAEEITEAAEEESVEETEDKTAEEEPEAIVEEPEQEMELTEEPEEEELPEILMPEGFDFQAEEEAVEEAEVEAVEEEQEEAVEEPEQEAEPTEAPEEDAEPEEAVEEELEELTEEPEEEELPEILMPEGFDFVEEEVAEESEPEAWPEEDIEESTEEEDSEVEEIEEEPEDSEEESVEDEDAADDLEARIVNSLSRDSLALADAEDGSLDGRIGEEQLQRQVHRKNRRQDAARGELTEEQQRMFSYFTPVHGMSDQLWTALENERGCIRGGTSNIGNIMITGEAGTGKTMLAVNLVKAIQKNRDIRSGRLAKISADTLNEKDVTAVLKKLDGGALIIERASELTNETAISLEMAMKGQTGELLFIFEDEKQALRRFMKLHPKIAQTCISKIDIPIFTNDELVEFGKCYAYELEYSIDEMAVLALYNRIGNMQRDDYDVSVTDVKKIIDTAIERSEKGGIGKLFSSLTKKRYDDDDCIILREKDFEE